MTELESRQVNQIINALCATALVPGLRSILVFDAHPRELRKIALTAAKILSDFNERPINTLTLGSSETDDDLWGSFMPQGHDETSPLFWQSGLLFGSEDDENSTRVALIPNLAQLSLMSARTCIALVGESVAALERHGQHRLWQPEIFWVAGCPMAEVGKVSAHLLDRFALRLNRKAIHNPTERVEEIKRMLNSEESEEEGESFPLPADLGETLRVAAEFRPRLTDEAIAHISNYISTTGFYSVRRDLALARLAVASAQLDKRDEVSKEYVSRAAQIIGLNLTVDAEDTQRKREEPEEQKEKPSDSLSTGESLGETLEPEQAASARSKPQLVQEFAREVDRPPETFPVSVLPPTSETSPYPEDETPVEHEDTPLRLPSRISRRDEAGKGPAIGTERATSLHDLALVRTLLEAAKFQPVRRKNSNSSGREFMLLPSDLHSYRREPIAEQMLVLLIDYTGFQDAAWEDALFPYLKEAYTGRAMICLIKVGAADARHELRAERIEARSILVPEIATAFNAKPGRATPLAHGLDLAFQALRRYLQHGRGGPYQATFVVLSDGRGNIPLEDSRRGEITAPVMRRGFDDALRLARQIRALDYVRVIYLNPQPPQHTELPLELAEALGAETQEVPVRTPQHV